MATSASSTLDQRSSAMLPGWYPDPSYPDSFGGATWLRYWDGTNWTSESALTVGASQAQPVEAQQPKAEADGQQAEPEEYASAVQAPPAPPAGGSVTYVRNWSTEAVLAACTPRRRRARRHLLVACGVFLIAIVVGFLGSRGTTRAAHKPAAPALRTAPAPLSMRVISPTDGATVRTRTVVVKGVVSSSQARVTINGRAAAVRGHRFAARVRLRLGENEFDVSGDVNGLVQAGASVTIIRTRTARERAAMLERRAAGRPAEHAQQLATTTQQPGAGTVAAPAPATRYATHRTAATRSVSADGDLELTPPKSSEPTATAPSSMSTSAAPSPAPTPAAPAATPPPPTP
jgi:uncharacterized Zn-binding protein involved in type VI secretion